MYIKTRNESFEVLSGKVSKECLSKAMASEYSDDSLSFIADLKERYASQILNCGYSYETINKLIEACRKNIISTDDLFTALEYPPTSKQNEKYVDDFLNSIANGVYPKTAARIFAAVGFDNISYNEAVDLIHSGAFCTSDFAELSVTDEIAKEIVQMNFPLRACEGFSFFYDIDSAERLNGALERGAAFIIPDKSLAVKINEAMKSEDWIDFRNYITKEMGKNISKLTGEKFTELHKDFESKMKSEQIRDTPFDKTSNLHFGILGNGITVYDVSKMDKQTNDYLTVAHISCEGNIKYYVDKNSLTEKDIESIENQAADRKANFTEQWNSLSVEEKYIRLYNTAVSLPKPQWDVFYNDKNDMVNKVKKYERSLIFRDADFPEKEESHCPAENAGYSIIKQEEVTDIDGTKLGTVLGKNASGNFVTWDYSYFPETNHFNGFNNGHYFSGEKGELKANADFHRRIAERAERIAAYEEIQEDCAEENFDMEE